MGNWMLRTVCTLFMFLGFLSVQSCGGGSSNDDESSVQASGDFFDIEIIPLSDQGVQEGEVVTLQVSAQGSGASKLTFYWSVSLDRESYVFQGQGQSKISFVAPQVEGSKDIYVRVDFDVEGGNLLGFTTDMATVTVLDTVYAVGQSTEISSVNSLDLAVLSGSGPWLLTQYETIFYEPLNSRVEFSSRTIVEFDSVNSDRLNLSKTNQSCIVYNRNESYLPLLPQAIDFACESSDDDVTTQYYQEGDDFRVEFSCNAEIIRAYNYKKINDPEEVVAELEIDFSSYNDLALTTDVCGSVAITTVIDDAGNESTATLLDFVTQYEGEPLNISVIVEDDPFGSIYFFGDDGFQSLYVASSVLTNINGVTKNESGSIRWDFGNTESLMNIGGVLDVKVTDLMDVDEDINIDFTFTFPSN